jgi:DNA polymerase-1
MVNSGQMSMPMSFGGAVRQNPLLLLIDGHAMVHRSFRAISVSRNLTVSTTGEDVTGVYGFASVFLRALNEWQPTHIAVAFDTPTPTFRHERFPEYKAQRPPTPAELRPQFDRVKELMTAFAVPVYELPGWEADDIIGTLSRQAEAADVETIILTGDRDTFQLITPRVRVDLASSERDRRIVGEEELAERYGGLTAAQQPDYKALVGDKSDNIPGVPSVGDKTATTLLTAYETLEGIYAHLDEITQKRVQNSLANNRDAAFEYRVLTTIDCDAPTTLDLDACQFGNYQRADVVALMTALEFHSIVGRVPSPDAPWTSVPSSADAQAPTVGDAPVAVGESDYRVVASADELQAMIDRIVAAGSFAFDTESSSTDPMAAELAGLSFAVDGGLAWYVPVGHREGQQLPLEEVLAAVRPLFTADGISRVAHNANYDLTLLSNYGIDPRGVIDHDTMISAHLLGNNRLGLKPLALAILGREMTEITDLIGRGAKQKTFNEVPIEDGAPYAAADADYTLRLRQQFEPLLGHQGLNDLMANVELPLVPVLVEMQRAGVRLDSGILHEMSRDLKEQLDQIETDLYGDIGHSVNINSPKQLSDLLFGELGLPKTRRTKSGYSTDANALESLKGMHPVVDRILDYRQVSKLKSTYVDALPEMVNANTGRIHTSYHQTGSATGRVSSSDPNLQNIPVRTELGRQVRRAFVADSGCQLLSADYSQIELRVLAHLSQDPSLLEAFRRGEDIHAATASQMFNVPINDVDGEQRRIAKVLNFGVIYGLGPYGISQQTGFSREEGRHFIDTYLTRYPGINDYLESVKDQTRATMYAETLLGRRRYFPDIQSTNHNTRAAAERMAINMPIQGTAADIMKLAMIRVHDRLQRENLRARMLLQVHDELVFEVPREEMDDLHALVFDEMPAAMDLDVTLKVEAKVGERWGDME